MTADGLERYGVYRHLHGYPIYAFMSYPKSAYVTTWWYGVRAPLYLIATVLAVDFGSGYSSFLYLAELPISFLKIEGWMVRNMRSNGKVYNMVQNIVLVAKRQGITIIAESIEEGETVALLREMGVDWGQGDFFGYPECELPSSRR